MSGIRSDLRQNVSSILRRHAEAIADDALAQHPLPPAAADDDCLRRLASQLLQLLAHSVEDAGASGHTGLVAQAAETAAERGWDQSQLFRLAAAIERAALDEIALDENAGATSEAWGAVARTVRRGSFDVLAAMVAQTTGAANTLTDPVTAARTRAYFDAALATECDRAGRFGDHLALLVCRVDDRTALDVRLGPGTSQKILGRIGVLIRQYFRRQDLVARYADDAIAIVLVRADADHADSLADRLRATIAHRLESADHRSGEAVPITVSVAVVHAGGTIGAVLDPERLMVDADRALQRARERGGNRTEPIRSAAAIRTPPRSSPSA